MRLPVSKSKEVKDNNNHHNNKNSTLDLKFLKLSIYRSKSLGKPIKQNKIKWEVTSTRERMWGQGGYSGMEKSKDIPQKPQKNSYSWASHSSLLHIFKQRGFGVELGIKSVLQMSGRCARTNLHPPFWRWIWLTCPGWPWRSYAAR